MTSPAYVYDVVDASDPDDYADTNVLCLAKDNGGRYVFLWPDDELALLDKTLGRYAADPELDFTWGDAAALALRARGMNSDGD